MNLSSVLKRCFFILSGLCFLSQAEAQSKRHLNLNKSGVAIKGYDAVSYFTKKGPTPGRSNLSYNYNGVVYYFSSKENKMKFVSDPEQYIPQYGGWCAYAMGKEGEKVSINPRYFKIIDGKLYLFFKNTFFNTLKDWNKDEERLHKQAEKHWQKIANN